MNVLRLIRIAVLILACASPLAAQEARFLVERIDVRNLRHASPQIVIAETRLTLGQSYTERELRAAADRINRLPFVLGADFALEKGSVRDTYVLVIRVTETKPFFYLTDATIYLGDRSGVTNSGAAAVGLRFFAGARGVFHAGLSAENDDRPYISSQDFIEAGYTHYDVFGTRAFVTLNLKQPTGISGRKSHTLPEVVIGVPLGANQTLTARYEQIATEGGADTRFAQRLGTIRLTYNTTNHPFFPTRGVLLSAGPTAVWNDTTSFVFRGGQTPPEVVVEHRRTLALEATAARYWELNDRDSLAATLEGGLLRTQPRVSVFGTTEPGRFGSADFAISHRTSPPAETVTEGESRVELHLHTKSYNRGPARYFDESSAQASVAWVHRNAWGSIRLGVGYAW
jgi:hypothetical protein